MPGQVLKNGSAQRANFGKPEEGYVKEVRGQVRVRSKVKTTGFHIIGFRAQLAQH